ncbi:hypothetical protein E1293_12820 [Actinomadura darangshiensis]|uniref:YCII-related domain-containing protein n=1 Tax=Actinomadura darangshiensis TaxID=705336 RepID=A0A4R5BL02_9ACTN|nr:YciI family protein [Actinomadura darangshiensis]TDD84512.1 hypothetical protein E1293_12820 [Actinomadura darangshiensis]
MPRYVMLLKAEENHGAPPPELMAEIGRLGEEAVKAGVLLDTAGLAPTAMGARVSLADGELSVHDGPFTEAEEVIISYAIYDLGSKEEAVEWASRFLRAHKAWPGWKGEAEIRQVFGPEDFGPPQ